MSKCCRSCNIPKFSMALPRAFREEIRCVKKKYKFWDTPYVRTYVNVSEDGWRMKHRPHKARARYKESSWKIISRSSIVDSHNSGEHREPSQITIWLLNNRAQGATLTRGEIESDCVAVVLTRSRIGKRDAEMRRCGDYYHLVREVALLLHPVPHWCARVCVTQP